MFASMIFFAVVAKYNLVSPRRERSVVLRDLPEWHAGLPKLAPEAHIMLAFA